jgi:hypothetical protein
MEGAIVAAIFAGTMLPLAVIAIRESTGRRNAEVAAARAEANATSYATQLADMTTRFQQEKDRGDRLEEAMSAIAAGPVLGAHERLLQALAAAAAARRHGEGVVLESTASTESRGGDTDLLRPGE